MLISELPDGLKELAEKRRNEDSLNKDKTYDGLGGAFNWSETSEGLSFWHEIFLGNFQPFIELKNNTFFQRVATISFLLKNNEFLSPEIREELTQINNQAVELFNAK